MEGAPHPPNGAGWYRVQIEEDLLAAGKHRVAIGRQPADTSMTAGRGCGVKDIDVMVAVEIWIECDSQQAAFAAGIGGQRGKRRR